MVRGSRFAVDAKSGVTETAERAGRTVLRRRRGHDGDSRNPDPIRSGRARDACATKAPTASGTRRQRFLDKLGMTDCGGKGRRRPLRRKMRHRQVASVAFFHFYPGLSWVAIGHRKCGHGGSGLRLGRDRVRAVVWFFDKSRRKRKGAVRLRVSPPEAGKASSFAKASEDESAKQGGGLYICFCETKPTVFRRWRERMCLR